MSAEPTDVQERVQRRSLLTHAERNREKAMRRMQFTMSHSGPAERKFLDAYDEVLGLAGKRAAGEYVRRCLLMGAAFMNGATYDVPTLLKQLGMHGCANLDPVSDEPRAVNTDDNTQTNESEISSNNESKTAAAVVQIGSGAGEAGAQGRRVMSNLLGRGQEAERTG